MTDKPIKYVIYSHHHYDHIAGGKPFKVLGATFVAHRRAKERLLDLKKQNALLPDVVMPDQVVDDKKMIKLGDTTLELIYVGRNHSDNSLVMRLPKEKLVFVVDFAPIEFVQFRNIPDNASPLEYIASLKKLAALDWDRMIPGHPYAGGRYGTKKDVNDDITYLEDLSAEVKKAADAGKCFDTAMKEVKLPKYEKWANYDASLPSNVERFCYWWGRGYSSNRCPRRPKPLKSSLPLSSSGIVCCWFENGAHRPSCCLAESSSPAKVTANACCGRSTRNWVRRRAANSNISVHSKPTPPMSPTIAWWRGSIDFIWRTTRRHRARSRNWPGTTSVSRPNISRLRRSSRISSFRDFGRARGVERVFERSGLRFAQRKRVKALLLLVRPPRERPFPIVFCDTNSVLVHAHNGSMIICTAAS